MSTKTMLIVTGAAAWIGGIATAMTVTSCDVEPCEGAAQPSAVVRIWKTEGSAVVPVRASSVQFQILAEGGDPTGDLATTPAPLQSGHCLDSSCTEWVVGSDQPGKVVVYAEVCGEKVTAETLVGLDDLGCHADTETINIQIDGTRCPVDGVVMPPYECEPIAHPSVHVLVARQYDDYFMPVDVDMVWFEYRGQTHEARCLQGNDDSCMGWIAGYELEGEITVSTEYCDTMVSKTVEVEAMPNSCHVQTEFVMLEVSTQGCLTAEDQSNPPPPPRPPWDLTAKLEPDPPPLDRPDTIKGEQGTDPPPPRPNTLTDKPETEPPIPRPDVIKGEQGTDPPPPRPRTLTNDQP